MIHEIGEKGKINDHSVQTELLVVTRENHTSHFY